MSNTLTDLAKVIFVGPYSIEIEITSTSRYEQLDEKLQIGSYVQISDGPGTDSKLIAVVRSFRIQDPVSSESTTAEDPRFVVTLQPLGRIHDGVFKRGSLQIAIPPKLVEIAAPNLLKDIYASGGNTHTITFSKLVQNPTIPVDVDGDRFFGKHIGIVGSTGAGKSGAVAAILQQAIKPSKDQKQAGILNNSHIIIFDLHGEYRSAFPLARNLGVRDLKLPYWLMNSEELEELFIESQDQNAYNQVSQFRMAVIENKRQHNASIQPEDISYDSPVYFSLQEVMNYLDNLNNEVISKLEGEGAPKLAEGTLIHNRSDHYFKAELKFVPTSSAKADKAVNGPFNGEFNRFLMRLKARRNDHRLDFLLDPSKPSGEDFTTEDRESLLARLVGYGEEQSNITLLDLSDIPFEVLSIVVSLVTRLIFALGFEQTRRVDAGERPKVPFLLVLEEAHNYVSRAEGAKYNSVRKSIERVAKEGRKYGVCLMIVSQRPSEISETVFSQCNNFIAMRLTNPSDQNYVKRLLPDDVGALTDSFASLGRSEALIIGDSVPFPSLVKVNDITDLPNSSDVAFKAEWEKDWFSGLFNKPNSEGDKL